MKTIENLSMPPTEVFRKFSEPLLGDGYCNSLARRPSRHRVGLDSRGAGRDAVRAHARTATVFIQRPWPGLGATAKTTRRSRKRRRRDGPGEWCWWGGMGNKPNKSRFTSLLIVFIDHRSDHFHT